MTPKKICYNCTCSSNEDRGIIDLVYQCDELTVANTPYQFEEYNCPPVYETCTTSTDSIKSAGYSRWFEDVVDASVECTEFCYCSESDGKICATGFDEIMANEELTEAFHYECGYKLRAVTSSHLFGS